VNKAATSTAVTSNNNPSFSGQAVTFTATVSNSSGTSAVPTGSVQFMDGASPLGSPQPVIAGKATLTTSALSVATHSITAVYSNLDGNFTGSTSPALSQVVKSADTTTSISAPAITYGANGLVTVTVAAVDPSAGTPTGNVTLSVDGGAATSQALVSGSTTFTIPTPNAGDHSLSASYAAQGNFNASSNTGTLHVNQAQATLSFGLTTFTYDGSPKPVTVNTSPANLSGVSITYDGGPVAPTNAGSYALAASLANPNYTATPISGTETIQQAQATLSFGTTTFTYDGSPKPVSVTTIPANLSGVSITYDGSPTPPSNAGSYALSASLTNANYTATPITGTETIDPIQVTVTISDPMPTYDGQPHHADISIVPMVAATVTYNGSPIEPTAAGSYAVVVMVTQANYSGGASGTLTIKKAPLTVTAADASRPYGQANPAFTGTLTGVVAGDGITATYISAATATTAAGVYGPTDANAITPTLSDPNNKLANYDVASTNGTLTITAIPLYVVADDKTRTFGGSNPAFDAQFFGFANGDTPASLAGTLTCTSANATAPAGTYAIHCGGLSSVDYAIHFVDGTLTVTDPLSTIAVNPNAPTVTYGGMQTFTAQGAFASAMQRNLANTGGMSYMLHDLSVTRAGAAAAEAGGKLYAIGGIANGGATPSNTVEVYNPMNDGAGWTSVANLGSARTNARAASVAGKVFVFGGCGDANCTSVLGTAEVYDPASDAWTGISSSGFTARRNPAAIPLNGKIYVAGGNDGNGTALSTVEIYDPGTDSWSSGPSLADAAGPASGGAINGTLYLVSSTGGNAVLQKFNGTTWTTVNAPAQTTSDAAAAVLNNVLYVVDGSNVHAYDPASNTWTDKASLNTDRLQPEPVAIGNLIYVAGNGGSGQSASLEAFAGDEVSWTSSDTTVASIDASGKASALKVGSSTITATSLNLPAVHGSTLMTVGPATVTPVVTVSDKNYDGTKSATITNETLTGVLDGDESSVSLTGGTALFDTKDVGTNKTVTVTGLSLTGSKALDYVLSSDTTTTTASIKAVYVQVTASSPTVTYGDPVPDSGLRLALRTTRRRATRAEVTTRDAQALRRPTTSSPTWTGR
jgi:N-acetylneuraminic acid mutarotase